MSFEYNQVNLINQYTLLAVPMVTLVLSVIVSRWTFKRD